jgi:hypothetical protein
VADKFVAQERATGAPGTRWTPRPRSTARARVGASILGVGWSGRRFRPQKQRTRRRGPAAACGLTKTDRLRMQAIVRCYVPLPSF